MKSLLFAFSLLGALASSSKGNGKRKVVVVEENVDILKQVLFFIYEPDADYCPYDKSVIGDLDKTAMFLFHYGDRMDAEYVRPLLLPWVRKPIPLVKKKLGAEIGFLVLDELLEKEEQVLNIADMIQATFIPENQHGLEGLVLLWQLDWMVHCGWEYGHRVETIRAVLSVKQALLTAMDLASTYWRNIARLGRIPFSFGVFSMEAEVGSQYLQKTYDNEPVYWGDVLRHVEDIVANSTEPTGSAMVRALAKTLPILMFVKSRGSFIENDMRLKRSCWIKIVHQWHWLAPNTKAQLITQSLQERMPTDVSCALLGISNKMVRGMSYSMLLYVYKGDEEEIAALISTLSFSPLFLKEFLVVLGRHEKSIFESQKRKAESFHLEKNNCEVEYAVSLGRNLAFDLVRFLLGEKKEADGLLMEFFLDDFNIVSGMIAQQGTFTTCMQPEFFVRLHSAGRIVISLFFRRVLFHPLAAKAVIQLTDNAVEDLARSEAKLYAHLETPLSEDWNSVFSDKKIFKNPTKLYKAVFNRVPAELVNQEIEEETGKLMIETLKLDPDVLRPLAMLIAFSNCTFFSMEGVQKKVGKVLNKFVMSKVPIYELPLQADLVIYTFPSINNTTKLNKEELSQMAVQQKLFLGHQFLWVLKHFVHSLLGEMQLQYSKHMGMTKLLLAKDLGALITMNLLEESNLERRAERMFLHHDYNNEVNILTANQIRVLIDGVFSFGEKSLGTEQDERNIYRTFTKDYFVAALSADIGIWNNPATLYNSTLPSLFNMKLTDIMSLINRCEPNHSLLIQIAATCLLSRDNKELQEIEKGFIEQVLNSDEGKRNGFLRVLNIRRNVLRGCPAHALSYLYTLRARSIHGLTRNLSKKKIAALYDQAIRKMQMIDAEMRKYFRRICFSLAVSSDFWDALLPDLYITIENENYHQGVRSEMIWKALGMPRNILTSKSALKRDELEPKVPADCFKTNETLRKRMSAFIRPPFRDRPEVWDFLEDLLNEPELGYFGVNFGDLLQDVPEKLPRMKMAVFLPNTNLKKMSVGEFMKVSKKFTELKERKQAAAKKAESAKRKELTSISEENCEKSESTSPTVPVFKEPSKRPPRNRERQRLNRKMAHNKAPKEEIRKEDSEIPEKVMHVEEKKELKNTDISTAINPTIIPVNAEKSNLGELASDPGELKEKAVEDPKKNSEEPNPKRTSEELIKEEKEDKSSKIQEIRNSKDRQKRKQEKKKTAAAAPSKPIEILFDFNSEGCGTPRKNLDDDDVSRIIKTLRFGPPLPFCLEKSYYERMQRNYECLPKTKLWKFKAKPIVVQLKGGKNPNIPVEHITRLLRAMDEDSIGRLQSLIFFSTTQKTTDLIVQWNSSSRVEFTNGQLLLGRTVSYEDIKTFLRRITLCENLPPLLQRKGQTTRERSNVQSNNYSSISSSNNTSSRSVAQRNDPNVIPKLSTASAPSKPIPSVNISPPIIRDETDGQFDQATSDSSPFLVDDSPQQASSAESRPLSQPTIESIFEDELSTGDSKDLSSSNVSISSSTISEVALETESDCNPLPRQSSTPTMSPSSEPFVYQGAYRHSAVGRGYLQRSRSLWHPANRVTPRRLPSLVNKITRHNMQSAISTLQNIILESGACAFDMEMSGLFPRGRFMSNFDLISTGVGIFQVVQFGLTCVKADYDGTAMFSFWSVMLCESGDIEAIVYDSKALEKIMAHGFSPKVHEAEYCESYAFMNAVFKLLRFKPLIVHNGLADFLHLMKLGARLQFASEEDFSESLRELFVEFWDTKALAVYGYQIPWEATELCALARNLCGIAFDERQAHEATFDSYLTMLLFLRFQSLSTTDHMHRNILFKKHF